MSIRAESSSLARYLFIAYALLIAYASLHPLSGWSDTGIGPIAWLSTAKPRYVTAFDIWANVLAYVPLGFLGVLALYPALRHAAAAAAATITATLLSGCLETLQTYLPSRVASNADLAANAAGALAGAVLGTLMARRLMRGGGLHTLRHDVYRSGARIDLGLVLLGLWIFSLLNPETLLFGNGDLRAIFQTPTGRLYPADVFIRVEAVVAGANTLAIGLFTAALLRHREHARLHMMLILIVGIAMRTLAYGILFNAQSLVQWITPGALAGASIGLILALIAASLPRTGQLAVAGLAMMFATVVVNIAPENPYLAAFLAQWHQGHFLNFNGLTRLVSALWPFVAIAYLISLAGDRRSRSANSEWGAN